MRDDEVINACYPLKCITRYDDEGFFYLSEVNTIQDVISKFLEMVVGVIFLPSKDYGARIAHRGKESSLVDKIFPIFSKKFDNNVTLFFRKTVKRNNKLIVKSNKLPHSNPKKL